MTRRWELLSAIAAAVCGNVFAQAQPADQRGAFTYVAQGLPLTDASKDVSVSVSGDGRFIAFESLAPLVPEDGNNLVDIYLLDRVTSEVVLVSRSFDGTSANGNSAWPRISADGRFVAFASGATRLVSRDTNARPDVFLWDRTTRTLERISVSARGEEGNGWSGQPAISDTGQTVAFQSSATNLVDGDDANGMQLDIYAYRRADGHMARVSTTAAGLQPAAGSNFDPTMSADGRLVAFTSSADLNCPPPPHAHRKGTRIAFKNVYLKDLDSGQLVCVSHAVDSGPANGSSYSAALDATGTWIAYVTDATNLGYRDGNSASDVVLQDLRTGKVKLISHDDRGVAANGPSWHPVVSATGQYVAFVSSASGLLCRRRCSPRDEDLNLVADVYLYDTTNSSMRRLSADGAGGWWASSRGPAFDRTGTVVAFSSSQPTSPSDLTGDEDLFILALDPVPPGAAFALGHRRLP